MPDSKASGKSMQNHQSACPLDQTSALQSQFVPVKVVLFSHWFSVEPWSLSPLLWFCSSTHQKDNSTPGTPTLTSPGYHSLLPSPTCLLKLWYYPPVCNQRQFPIALFRWRFMQVLLALASAEAVLSTSPECRDFCILVEE